MAVHIQERHLDCRKFVEIVEARVSEIIENVWFQVPNDFTDKLMGGIILTGGGSNMKNIEQAFRNHTHIQKIRIAHFVSQVINSNNPDINAKDGTMNTVLGLLAKGDMNCAGEEITNDLFGQSGGKTVTTADLHKNPRSLNETSGRGVVQTEAEKQMAEEEARKKKEEEEEKARREAEQKAKEEEERKKEKSFWHKTFKGLKDFGKKMIQEEE